MASRAVRSAVPGTRYLALDLGATSGRAVVGTLDADGSRMRLEEVHRFPTLLVEDAGHLHWDFEALWAEVRTGLARALALTPDLRAVSVASWAVDYLPLDADGVALRRPYAYRDPRAQGRLEQVLDRLGGADALYARTGTQFLPFNTLSQVVADLADEPATVARTSTRLLIADALLHRLSGVAEAERTMASTTQLLDARTGGWAHDLIAAIGDEPARWPRVVAPGTVLGPLLADAVPAGALPAGAAPLVVAGCSHDTAAAVAAVPASGDAPWAYVSSGTWSLVGAELDAPVLHADARAAGFTNEGGLDGTIRFLKNRTGMWVLEECVREWAPAGERPGYEALFAAARAEPPSARTLDLDAPAFAARGDMVARIEAACRAAAAPVPATRGALVRLVLDSLADGYRRTLDELEALTGTRAAVIHVVGGGARNALLNQLTADACARPVVAGPDEATALGILLVQARALGDLRDGLSVRTAARASSACTEFAPRHVAATPTPALATTV